MYFYKKTMLRLILFLFYITTNSYGTIIFEGSADPPVNKLVLWYEKPATDWETEALPIGNGTLGGMIFGGVEQEHIQINESSLWNGGPNQFGAYQNFGDIILKILDLPDPVTVSDYRRELDIENAIARVTYSIDSVIYSREYFSSYPDQVLVMQLTSDQPNKLSLDVQIDDAHNGTKSVSDNQITISGTLSYLTYEAQLCVFKKGGTLTADTDKITITEADTVTILLAAGTDYDTDPTSTSYKTSSPPHDRITMKLNKASSKSYNELKSTHTNDYKNLFDRVVFNLNENKPEKPTDQLLSDYKSGNYDRALEVLYYQYGRYLLISSSRPGGLPANLQGIWNHSNSPPWNCDYHSNINLQMNYWHAEPTNLTECHEPLIDYLEKQQTAWTNYASQLGARGWTLKTENNPFGVSGWNWHRPGNAWYCMHLWQHYTYNLEIDYLSRVYPMMKSACEFWFDRLVTDTDSTWVAPDEWSPEHGPWEDGVPYAQQVIWDLFTNTINASKILNSDSSFRNDLQNKLDQLDPGLQVGNWGQLREWKNTNDSQSDKHRHISHLWGLSPGKQISPYIDPIYTEAAKVSLNARGDNTTGWAIAHRINCWARLLDGNRALSAMRKYLIGGMTYKNLFDTHPPLQIDGNFGGTAGMTEMLLQSQLGEIQLLPSLPNEWPEGYVKGLKALNGFVIDIEWADTALTKAVILSVKGEPCRLRGNFDIRDMVDNPITGSTTNGITSFATESGHSYTVVPITSSSILPIMAPRSFSLGQNAPNPFNPITVISYNLQVDSKVKLAIYDITGKKIKTLISENQPAGIHSIRWNASNEQGNRVSSGIYFYRIHVLTPSQTLITSKKMVLLK